MSRFSCGRLRGFGRPRLLESCRSLSRNLADHRVAGPSPLNRENRANNGSHGGEPETEQTAADREETQRKTRKKRRGNQLEIPLSHGKSAYPRGIQRFVRTMHYFSLRDNFKTRYSKRNSPTACPTPWSISTPIRRPLFLFTSGEARVSGSRDHDSSVPLVRNEKP